MCGNKYIYIQYSRVCVVEYKTESEKNNNRKQTILKTKIKQTFITKEGYYQSG